MTVKRYSKDLRLDAIRLDENGFLRSKAFATRTGVFTYRKADGSVFRELRPPEEVFNEDSMNSLKMVPITNEHPAERLVSPKNAKRLTVGSTGAVYKDKNFVATELVVTDEKAINDVNAGKQELSCGYVCELDISEGTFEGERYDAIQRNIRYNHLAIVARGRAGADVKIHLDSEDAVEVDQIDDGEQKKEKNDMEMKKMKLADGVEIELPLAEAAKLDQFLKGMKKDMKKADSEDTEIVDTKEVAKLTAKIDMLEDELKKSAEKLDAAQSDESKITEGVKARLALEKAALKHLKADTDTIEMSDKDIKVAIIKSKRESFSEENKCDTYIDAAFDLACEVEAKADVEVEAEKKKDPAYKAIEKTDENQTVIETSEDVRARRMREDSELWKKPLSSK